MRKIYFTIFASFSIWGSAYGQIPTTGLISHFPFSGNANDVVNSLQNGTVFGATLTKDRFGNANSAYLFNGTSNYISIPPSNFLNHAYSYSCWINAAANPTVGAYAYSVGTPGQNGAEGADGGINGYLSEGIDVGSYGVDGNGYGVTVKSMPNTNQWYHVVETRDSLKVKLYVNGNIVDSTFIGNVLPFYGSAPVFNIGVRFNGTYYFNGALDDFYIYNRVISSSEVKKLYADGGLTGYSPVTYNSNIDIYPNPTKDILVVKNGDFINNAYLTIKITNILGELVSSTILQQPQVYIDLSSVTKGIYLLYVLDAEGNTQDLKKVIVQ